MQEHRAGRIEGYAIVSEDGMLATAAGIMPDALKFDADARFFEAGLNGVDVVVHGRHSEERQPNSPQRRRLILTRQVASIDKHRSNVNALLWYPAGASFEQALAALGMPDADIGVIGGPDVFGSFTMTPSICRVHPTCYYRVAGRCFRKFLTGHRRMC